MIIEPTYKLNCKKWGEQVHCEITGIRCCEICHTIIPETTTPGHLVPAIGKRDYRKIGNSTAGSILLVCCGVQTICTKQPGIAEVEKLASVIDEKKYWCPSCIKGVKGVYSSYLQEIVCHHCGYHLADMVQ